MSIFENHCCSLLLIIITNLNKCKLLKCTHQISRQCNQHNQVQSNRNKTRRETPTHRPCRGRPRRSSHRIRVPLPTRQQVLSTQLQRTRPINQTMDRVRQLRQLAEMLLQVLIKIIRVMPQQEQLVALSKVRLQRA